MILYVVASPCAIEVPGWCMTWRLGIAANRTPTTEAEVIEVGKVGGLLCASIINAHGVLAALIHAAGGTTKDDK